MESYQHISTEDLLRRCTVSGDGAAWQEFVRRFHRPIATVVMRMAAKWGDAARQTADDLVQETYLKLCANDYRMLQQFEHRNPEAFAAFVKVVAANVVRDHFKSSYSKKRGANKIDGIGEVSLVAAAENSAGSVGAIERAALMQDVQRHLEQFIAGADRERNSQIFWLYYRVGLSAAAIAGMPAIGLTTKGVESLILRMTRDLRTRMAHAQTPAKSILGTRESGAREAVKGILHAESF